MSKQRIIIVGGGFAGAKCAKVLRKQLRPEQCEIILFNRENHMVFHPLLAEIASNVIEPRHVAAPLRQMLKNVWCRSEEVIKLDLDTGKVHYEAEDGLVRQMAYDHLVIAHGNSVNLAAIPGMQDHAFPLKTIGDAIALQSHIIEKLEKAEVCENEERKRWHLSFVVVGGGFSGVEVAGEINDFVKRSRQFYDHIGVDEVKVTLVHGRDQILPEVSPSLREFARAKMEQAGVRFILNRAAALCTADGVGLNDGSFIQAATVICTIGTRPSDIVEQLSVEKERGRLVTAPDMSLPEYPNAWAIGDCAAIINSYDNKLSPPTGQFAERQGAQVAHNIVARMDGGETKPFSHRSLGSLCSIGGRSAVAETMGLKISGVPAWFVWRGVYLMKLPTVYQKIKVGMQWACDIFFPPEMAVLKADPSKRIGSAHFTPGNYVFRSGDQASDFYVIRSGEVEILEPGKNDDSHRVVAVLGPGDFFGERALVESRPRKHHARAKTHVELMVMGKSIYSQMSSTLAPLRDAVAESIKRRTPIWDKLQIGKKVLDSLELAELVEPLLASPFKLEDRVRDVVSQMRSKRLESCFVVDENEQLTGLVARTDLIRAIEVAAAMPEGTRLQMTLKDLSVRSPIAITMDDTAAVAVATMRERGLKSLPVVASSTDRRIQGVIRIESIFDSLIRKLERGMAPTEEFQPAKL